MVTAIQSASTAPMQAAVARPADDVARASTPEPVQAAAAAVIAPPKKAEFKLDTETMRKNLQEAIDRINQMMRDGGRGLNFSIDDKLNGPIIVVRNQDSGEVIRQIPNEVVVRVAHSIEDLKGMLHNASV